VKETVKETDELMEQVLAELDTEDPTLEAAQANIAKNLEENDS
jgi:hypothetical protein